MKKEPEMIEGHTYLAKIKIDPFAYRGIMGHKSLVGKMVHVRLGTVTEITWPSGGTNACHRSNLTVIEEVKLA
jgi:hypothetical protein